jgi:very-short-patch-repair endonuclease
MRLAALGIIAVRQDLPSPLAGEDGARSATDKGGRVARIRISPRLPRALRSRSTACETKLWHILRSRRLAHTKWRRQSPVGNYIVDFLCYEYRLIVECDGSQHAESARDEVRDRWLTDQGFTVVRFWKHEVLQNPTGVTDTILARAGLPF